MSAAAMAINHVHGAPGSSCGQAEDLAIVKAEVAFSGWPDLALVYLAEKHTNAPPPCPRAHHFRLGTPE